MRKAYSSKNANVSSSPAEIRTLSCGTRLAVEVMPGVESFALGFFLPFGAAHETRQTAGISHFIEHMLFKGSRRRSPKQIVQAIERVGGVINASTGREMTYFFVRIGSTKLELAIDVLTDLVFNPAFEEQSVELEKRVVLEEMKMMQDDPEAALFDRFLISVHGNTPFGRPILGFESSLANFSREMVVDYHKARYSPAQLLVSVAGGVDPDKVHSVLERKLRRFSRSTPPGRPRVKPPAFKPVILAQPKDVEQAALIVGFPSVGVSHPERYTFTILDAITAGGMMSRLFQEVREKRGLVYSIDSTQQPYSSGGLFTIEAGTREENLLKVLRLIFKELVDIAQKGPGKKELADTKLYLKGSWALGLEATTTRMIRNAMSAHFFGRLLSHEEVTQQLDAVTADRVARAARAAFENGCPGVGVLSKFDEGRSVKAVQESIEDLVERFRADFT